MSIRHASPSRGGVVAVAPRAPRRLDRVLAAVPARRGPTPTCSWFDDARAAVWVPDPVSGYFVDGSTGKWKNNEPPYEGKREPATIVLNDVHVSLDCRYWTEMGVEGQRRLLEELMVPEDNDAYTTAVAAAKQAIANAQKKKKEAKQAKEEAKQKKKASEKALLAHQKALQTDDTAENAKAVAEAAKAVAYAEYDMAIADAEEQKANKQLAIDFDYSKFAFRVTRKSRDYYRTYRAYRFFIHYGGRSGMFGLSDNWYVVARHEKYPERCNFDDRARPRP